MNEAVCPGSSETSTRWANAVEVTMAIAATPTPRCAIRPPRRRASRRSDPAPDRVVRSDRADPRTRLTISAAAAVTVNAASPIATTGSVPRTPAATSPATVSVPTAAGAVRRRPSAPGSGRPHGSRGPSAISRRTAAAGTIDACTK